MDRQGEEAQRKGGQDNQGQRKDDKKGQKKPQAIYKLSASASKVVKINHHRVVYIYPVRYCIGEVLPPDKEPYDIRPPEKGVTNGEEFTWLNAMGIRGRSYLRPLRSGFIYVHWIADQKSIWQEYKVEDASPKIGFLQQIFWSRELHDVRPANGPKSTFMRLPCRKVDIAFSEVQWSRERLIELETHKERRTARMDEVDLRPWSKPNYRPGPLEPTFRMAYLHLEVPELPQGLVKAIRDEATDKKRHAAALCVRDALGDARQRARNYKTMWSEMEKCVERVQQEKWYPCAAILATLRGSAKHDKQLASQLESLNERTMDNSLDKERRANLRKWIDYAKEELIECLSPGELLRRLVGAFEDYAALPRKPPSDDDRAPCYVHQWAVAAELFELLCRPSYALDAHLDEQSIHMIKSTTDDMGRNLIATITDPAGGHPLHHLLFPPEGDCDVRQENVVASTAPFRPVKIKDIVDATKDATDVISEFVKTLADLGLKENQKDSRSAVIGLVSRAGIQIENSTVSLVNFITESQDSDHPFNADDYIVHTTLEEGPQKLSKKTTPSKFDGGGMLDGQRVEVQLLDYVEDPITKERKLQPVATTTLKDLAEGEGLSLKKAQKGDLSKKNLVVTKHRVTRTKMPQNSFKRSAIKNQTTFDANIGRIQAILDIWSLHEAVQAIKKSNNGPWSKEGAELLESVFSLLETSMTAFEYYNASLRATAASSIDDAAILVTKTSKNLLGKSLGIAANVVGAGISFYDAYRSLKADDDDAAFAHFFAGVGCLLCIFPPTALVGAIVLVTGSVCAILWTDRPLEKWIKEGPFSTNYLRIEEAKKNNKDWADMPLATESLLYAAYGIRLQVHAREERYEHVNNGLVSARIKIGNIVEVELTIPYYIPNESKVYFGCEWSGYEHAVSKEFRVKSIDISEAASNNRYKLDLAVPMEIERSYSFMVEVRVRLQVDAAGNLLMPPRSQSICEDIGLDGDNIVEVEGYRWVSAKAYYSRGTVSH